MSSQDLSEMQEESVQDEQYEHDSFVVSDDEVEESQESYESQKKKRKHRVKRVMSSL